MKMSFRSMAALSALALLPLLAQSTFIAAEFQRDRDSVRGTAIAPDALVNASTNEQLAFGPFATRER
jgi:hypothetical protein